MDVRDCFVVVLLNPGVVHIILGHMILGPGLHSGCSGESVQCQNGSAEVIASAQSW